MKNLNCGENNFDTFEFAGLGLYRYKFDGTLEFISELAFRLFDLHLFFSSSHQVIGKKLQDLISTEAETSVYNELIKNGKIKGFEYYFKSRTGNCKWLNHNSFITKNDKGEDVIEVIIRDITESKVMQDLLAAEKERLSVTLDSIAEGVIATDTEGNVLLINKVAEQLTEWPRAEASGNSIVDVFMVIDKKTKQIRDNIIEQLKEKKVHEPVESILISRNATERIIWENSSSILDKDGHIIGAVIVFRDITERKKLEEEILKASKFETLGLLAGGIAHDFNNILTGIMGNISLAKMYSVSGDEIYEILTDAEKATFRAKDLTKQLFTLSKGKSPVKESASIADLLRDSTYFALRGSNVTCEFSLPGELWPVEIDSGQISQVINNLIINAKQVMPDGGKIEISASNIVVENEKMLPLKKGKYIKFSIEDHGFGIPKKILHKIFDPYFTTKEQGSGLGLTTSYSIIKNHNGHITVESEISSGTKFTIYLPASEEQLPDVKRESTLKGEGKILLMDDEEIVLKVTKEILKRLGYDVEVARDGTEMVEIYRRAKDEYQPFDAVIVDLTIPGGMGGKEAVGKLMEIDPHVKALASSGYAESPIMIDFKKYGFSGIITKPFKISDLSKTLHKILN